MISLFQNDISFTIKDIEKDFSITNLSDLIKELMDYHESNSVAAPFFFAWEQEDIEDLLPEGWEIEIDSSNANEIIKYIL